MLGERLFPLIQGMQPDLAGKITGMLLEIDNTELLHMLESRESLKAKVCLLKQLQDKYPISCLYHRSKKLLPYFKLIKPNKSMLLNKPQQIQLLHKKTIKIEKLFSFIVVRKKIKQTHSLIPTRRLSFMFFVRNSNILTHFC
jgi:hypothetical protein